MRAKAAALRIKSRNCVVLGAKITGVGLLAVVALPFLAAAALPYGAYRLYRRVKRR